MSRPLILRNESLLWFAACAMLCIHLGTTGTWQSEDRWLEIVREMRLSGDYFRPSLNGVLYFDKPLLSYWFVAGFSFIFGSLNEWMLRLPSAISGLLVLWATVDLGKRLWDRDTALSSGWILITSFGFVQWARLGEADMENLAASMLAVNYYWRNRDAMRFGGYCAFYCILAIGAQCKGLTAIVVPLLAIAPDLFRNKPLRHINIPHITAIAIGAALYFVPFLLAPEGAHAAAQNSSQTLNGVQAQSGLALVIRENVTRYFAPFDHTDPWYTYFLAIPRFLFPWSLLFVFALVGTLRNKQRGNAHDHWLLAVIALIFIFFTLSGSRRNYYILPIIPYCALLIAIYLNKWLSTAAVRWQGAVLVIGALLELSIVATWPLLQQRTGGVLPDSLRWMQLVIGVAALFFAIRSLQKRGDDHARISAATGAAFVLIGAFFFYQQLVQDSFRTEIKFAKQFAALARLHPDAKIATYRERPGGELMFYGDLAPDVTVLKNSDELRTLLESGDKAFVLAYREYDNELPTTLTQAPAAAEEIPYLWETHKRDKLRAWLVNAP